MIALSFILSLIAFACTLVFLPGFPMLVFAPFCALVIQKKSQGVFLWSAALVGMLYDCFSSSTPFGLFSLCYTLTAQIVSLFKTRAFASYLPLHTVLFSSIYLLVQLVIIQKFSPFFVWIPLVDGLYAFFWHSTPLMIYTRVYDHRWKSNCGAN
jgi:hypothetical protein